MTSTDGHSNGETRMTMPEDNLPRRTMRTTFWLSALLVLLFEAPGERTIALGLAIGTAIGLFSLWSLIYAVPRLFRPGAIAPKFSFGLIALMKLPIYCGVLSFSMTSPLVAPFAVFCGAAMVPAVIFLKTVGMELVKWAQPTAEETAVA